MRLINADALKKAITELDLDNTSHWSVIQKIDNAPTVSASLIVKDMTEEDIKNFAVIYQRATSKGLLSPAIQERPQGEWIDRMADEGYVECPFCHKQISGGDLNFCVKCGADMRKGDET